MNVIVYGKANCPYCENAVDLLEDLELPYQYISVDHMSTEDKENLKKEWNMKTVPIIIVEGKLIGGYQQLSSWAGRD